MSDGCEYAGLCRRMETSEHKPISYWPRDPRLKEYCGGKQPEQCCIHTMWGDNPQLREAVKKTPARSETTLPIGALNLSIGAYFFCMNSPRNPQFYLGCLSTLAGLGLISEGLTRRYKGKGLLRWLKTRNDRDGTAEIYDRLLGKADGSEDAELGVEDIFGQAQPINDAIQGHSEVRGIVLAISSPKKAEWKGTRFNAGRLNVSYPLTEDAGIVAGRDIGVALSYEYKQRLCKDPSCQDTLHKEDLKAYYATGVIAPVIHSRRATGTGFIQGMRHQYLPILVPMPVKMDDGVDIGLGLPGSSEVLLEQNSIENIFGGQKAFDEVAKRFLDDKTVIDARNLQRLMQEVLYSDF